jgi:hypothetical protein
MISYRATQERASEGGVGLAGGDAKGEDLPGVDVDHGADDEASEEAADPGEVDRIDVAGRLGPRERAGTRETRRCRTARRRPSKGALDARSGGLEAQPGEDARDPAGAPAGPLALHEAGEFADEVGQLVDGLAGVDEPDDALLGVSDPVDDALAGKDEGFRGRLDRHSMPQPVSEDLKPLPRPEVRTPVRIEPPQARTEEIVFGLELLDPLS